MELWQILTLIFGILTGFFGYHWNKMKTLIKEIGILFNIISESLKDDSLTKEELIIIIEQFKKLMQTFKKKGEIEEKDINETISVLKSIKK